MGKYLDLTGRTPEGYHGAGPNWLRKREGHNATASQLAKEGVVQGARRYLIGDSDIYTVNEVRGGDISVTNERTRKTKNVGSGAIDRSRVVPQE